MCVVPLAYSEWRLYLWCVCAYVYDDVHDVADDDEKTKKRNISSRLWCVIVLIRNFRSRQKASHQPKIAQERENMRLIDAR